MMNLVWMALSGLIVGVFAKILSPGKDPGGIGATMLIGVLGTFLGYGIRSLLGGDHDGSFNIFSFWDWIYSIGGAVLLLFIWKKYIAPKVGNKKELE